MIENKNGLNEYLLVLAGDMASVVQDEIDYGEIVGDEIRRLAKFSCNPGKNKFVLSGLKSAIDQINRNNHVVEEAMKQSGKVDEYMDLVDVLNDINKSRKHLVGYLVSFSTDNEVDCFEEFIDLTNGKPHLELVPDIS